MVTISTENLSVRLGRRDVLHGISARFEPGTLIGVIGPNGAGKSTLVRALVGLIDPHEGTVTLDGHDLAQLPARERARRVAYLPQGQTLHWPLTVERLVALGRLPHLGPISRISEEDQAAIEEAMARADVSHLAERVATELSGGERARALLARALAVGAKALVVDEPLASLDPGHQIDVMEMLVREAQGGAMVLAVLHDLNLAARHCDRLLVIDNGRLVADGPPAEVLTEETLRTVYGVTGYSRMLDDVPLVVPLTRWRG
ncbi:iron complex transport system ATP-binding protein [Novosphingobium sp. PhB165]|uniref:ABC transporter ATP-binding protein n=1 Tax=Novosphingobium sp. PhB165 TaxID=2485105 RepID=UPI00104D895D|nr:ABC transporter ATP-binding protein [Novosphingobium sp. PhB165]TCM15698.1 iron complex transport system ATP-binding protein [Novosphingobium sp. PhB165]